MPGKLIKPFDSQADWQSGTLENLDATSQPGLLIPIGDYTKAYDSQDEWNQGTVSNVVSTTDGSLTLVVPTKGNIGAGLGVGTHAYIGQRISARGLLSSITLAAYDCSDEDGSNGTWSIWVTKLNGSVLWQSPGYKSGAGYLTVNPNLVVDEDVVVWGRSWADYFRMSNGDELPPGVTENCREGDSPSQYAFVEARPMYISYKCEYVPSGTWLSPWLAHGIASPQSGLIALKAETPSGASVKPEVRYSSNGGSTYTGWYDLDERMMREVQGTHVQLRLTLATDDPKQTPVVDRATLLIGKLHRWTSPAISILGAGDSLMLAVSRTDLDVQMEIMPGEDQFHYLSPTQVSILTTTWGQVGVVFPNPKWTSIKIRLTMLKTSAAAQSLDKVSLWDAIVADMYGRPQVTLSPPQVTHVTAYVEGAEPAVEYTASVPVSAARKVHIRVAVPEGSSLAYCQEVAERVLAAKSRERVSIECVMPLLTRIRFGELVAVSLPYMGYPRHRPYIGRLQKMEHRPLADPPQSRLWIGDFLPEDAEVIVRLLKEGR